MAWRAFELMVSAYSEEINHLGANTRRLLGLISVTHTLYGNYQPAVQGTSCFRVRVDERVLPQ